MWSLGRQGQREGDGQRAPKAAPGEHNALRRRTWPCGILVAATPRHVWRLDDWSCDISHRRPGRPAQAPSKTFVGEPTRTGRSYAGEVLVKCGNGVVAHQDLQAVSVEQLSVTPRDDL